VLGVLTPLRRIRTTCGNDAYDVIGFAVTVTHDQEPQLNTQAEKHEPILIVGMLRVGDNPRVLV
jgi:hypothetical protein